MRRAAAIGFATALVSLALDQASKLILLFVVDLPVREPVVLGPFLNLVSVWNRGISYGFMQQETDLGRWLLVGLSAVASVALSVWIVRAGSALLAVALGLIAGGAVGNAIDRIAYAAVFDFAQLHMGAWSWYVFNIADVAIVAGVAGLLYDSLLPGRSAGVRPSRHTKA